MRCLLLLLVLCSSAIAQDVSEHWAASKKLAYNPNEIPKTPPDIASGSAPHQVDAKEKHNFSCWAFVVEQVVDKENMVLRLGKRELNYYWLKGYPTKGISDGDKVSIIGLVKFDDPKSFVNSFGVKRTVKAFHIMTQDQLDKEREEQEEKELAKRMEHIETLELKDGTKIEAVAIQSKKGVITLITKEKQRREVALADFTPKALAEVRKQLKK